MWPSRSTAQGAKGVRSRLFSATRVAERVAEKRQGRSCAALSRCHEQRRSGHDPPDGMASQSPPARAPVGSLLDLLGLRIRRSGEQPPPSFSRASVRVMCRSNPFVFVLGFALRCAFPASAQTASPHACAGTPAPPPELARDQERCQTTGSPSVAVQGLGGAAVAGGADGERPGHRRHYNAPVSCASPSSAACFSLLCGLIAAEM